MGLWPHTIQLWAQRHWAYNHTPHSIIVARTGVFPQLNPSSTYGKAFLYNPTNPSLFFCSLSPTIIFPYFSLSVMPLFLSFSLSHHHFSLSLSLSLSRLLPCLELGVLVLRKRGKAKGNRFFFSYFGMFSEYIHDFQFLVCLLSAWCFGAEKMSKSKGI